MACAKSGRSAIRPITTERRVLVLCVIDRIGQLHAGRTSKQSFQVRNSLCGFTVHRSVGVGSRRSEAVPEKYPTHLPTIALARSPLGAGVHRVPSDMPSSHSPYSPRVVSSGLQSPPCSRCELCSNQYHAYVDRSLADLLRRRPSHKLTTFLWVRRTHLLFTHIPGCILSEVDIQMEPYSESSATTDNFPA